MLDRQSILFIAVFLLTAAFLLLVSSVVQEQEVEDLWLAGAAFAVSVIFWIWLFTESREEVRAMMPQSESDTMPRAQDWVVSDEGVAEAEKPGAATAEVEPSAEAKAEKQYVPVETPEAADEDEVDDLERIEGIGPKYRDALLEAGYSTFAKLALAKTEDLEAVVKDAGMRRPASLATWAEQAALAANDDWEALDALQEKLSGGRRG